MSSPLFWRPFVAFVAMLFLGGLGLHAWISDALRREATRDALASLESRLQLAYLDLSVTKGGSLRQATIQKVANEHHIHFTLLDLKGKILLDSEDPDSEASVADWPEVSGALDTGRGEAYREEDNTACLARKVTLEDRLENDRAREVEYILRGAVSLTGLERRRSDLKRALLWVGLGIALAAAVVLRLHVHRVRREVAVILEGAEAVASGETNRRISLTSRDELGLLGPAFNRMAEGLADRIDTIAQERNQLQAILSSMIEGVVAVDTRCVVLHMNAVAGELLRVSSSTARGKRLHETTRVREVAEVLEQALAKGASVEHEVELPGPGERRIAQLRASALEDGRGERVGAVVVLHDLTAMRILEQMRKDFVANVSHELKTPLTAIQGFVETILCDDEMPEELQRRFLGRIASQSDRLGNLVRDLLALAHLEARGQRLELHPLDLREPLRRTLEAVLPAAENRGVHLHAHLPSEPVWVEGEIGAIEQIASNLLDNAIKYSQEGGNVELRLLERGGQVWLEVSDDGMGIEESHLPRIFERFYRVDKARSRDVGGTGLGLAIVKHLCLALGGEVEVSSKVGHGTTFSVRLNPSVSPEEAGAEAAD